MALVVVPLMLALVAAPIVAGLELLSRLKPPSRPRPSRRVRQRLRAVSTRALIAWLVIPLLVIGLWAAADVLTERAGLSRPAAEAATPVLVPAAVPGKWKASAGAVVSFLASGRFTESDVPGPPPGDVGQAGVTIPRAGSGTWQLTGSPGYQQVLLDFSGGGQLSLDVTYQPVSGGQSYFVLQLYLGSGQDMNPAYQLTKPAQQS